MTTRERMEKVLDEVFSGDIDASAVEETSRLKEDLGMNSVAMLYMALGLEAEFGIKFVNTDFAGLITVKDVIDCIEAKLS